MKKADKLHRLPLPAQDRAPLCIVFLRRWELVFGGGGGSGFALSRSQWGCVGSVPSPARFSRPERDRLLLPEAGRGRVGAGRGEGNRGGSGRFPPAVAEERAEGGGGGGAKGDATGARGAGWGARRSWVGGKGSMRALRGESGKGRGAEGRGSAGYPEHWASPHRRLLAPLGGVPASRPPAAGSPLSPVSMEEPPPPPSAALSNERRAGR